MIIDADIYLEHYGVPGMRWGHRRARRKAEKEIIKENLRFAKQERNRLRKESLKRTGTKVAVAGALAAGAIATRAIINKNGSKKVSVIPSPKKWNFEFNGIDGHGKKFSVQAMSREAFDLTINEMMNRTANYG